MVDRLLMILCQLAILALLLHGLAVIFCDTRRRKGAIDSATADRPYLGHQLEVGVDIPQAGQSQDVVSPNSNPSLKMRWAASMAASALMRPHP